MNSRKRHYDNPWAMPGPLLSVSKSSGPSDPFTSPKHHLKIGSAKNKVENSGMFLAAE
jgi:hypothetical protein